MNFTSILKNEMKRSGGSVRVVKVAAERRPSAEALKKLDRQINAQLSANEAMRTRSAERASRLSSK